MLPISEPKCEKLARCYRNQAPSIGAIYNKYPKIERERTTKIVYKRNNALML